MRKDGRELAVLSSLGRNLAYLVCLNDLACCRLQAARRFGREGHVRLGLNVYPRNPGDFFILAEGCQFSENVESVKKMAKFWLVDFFANLREEQSVLIETRTQF